MKYIPLHDEIIYAIVTVTVDEIVCMPPAENLKTF